LRRTSVPRLRLSSLEPWDLAPEFFDLWSEDDRLQPHVHLPLQSGCDATLKRMARRTTQDDFRRLIGAARAKIRDLSVSTDVIVGFPGETAPEFETSVAFVEEMEFSKLHVFRYSRRDMTAAAAMPDQVAHETAQERSNRMHTLGNELEMGFQRRFVGRTMPVLWESPEPRPEGWRWSGLTGSYVRVVTAVDEGVDLRNRIIDAKITGVMPGGLAGEAQIKESCEALAM
jgi:threonylcarbamoyladenosine tRNA methylthiotransferase MtaB